MDVLVEKIVPPVGKWTEIDTGESVRVTAVAMRVIETQCMADLMQCQVARPPIDRPPLASPSSHPPAIQIEGPRERAPYVAIVDDE